MPAAAIGLPLSLCAPRRQKVAADARSPAYVLSVDINSGMNGDSGEGVCVRSDCTVSIGTLKYGHILGLLAGKIGLLRNYDIGIPCRGATSCPDQLARAIDAYEQQEAK